MTHKVIRHVPELRITPEVPERKLQPAVPGENEVIEIVVRVPASSTPPDPNDYANCLPYSRAVNVRYMTAEQIAAVSRVRVALRGLNYLEGGRVVDSHSGAIRWILEAVTNAINGK